MAAEPCKKPREEESVAGIGPGPRTGSPRQREVAKRAKGRDGFALVNQPERDQRYVTAAVRALDRKLLRHPGHEFRPRSLNGCFAVWRSFGARCSQPSPASRSRNRFQGSAPDRRQIRFQNGGTSESRAAVWLRPASRRHTRGCPPSGGVSHRGSGMSVADQSSQHSIQSSPSTWRVGWPSTMRTASQSAKMLRRSSAGILSADCSVSGLHGQGAVAVATASWLRSRARAAVSVRRARVGRWFRRLCI